MIFHTTEIGDAMLTHRIEIVTIHLLVRNFDETVRRKVFTLFRHTVCHVNEFAIGKLFYLVLDEFVQIQKGWTYFATISWRYFSTRIFP